MKRFKNISLGILITVLVITNSYASEKDSIITTGSVIRIEGYTLFEDHFDYDTLSNFKMVYQKDRKIELFFSDSEPNSDNAVLIEFKEGSYSVKLSNEELVVESVFESVYRIAGNTYEVSVLNVNSKTDDHLALTYFILKNYGIILSESRLWNNHLRYLPANLNKSIELNLLCDLILTRLEFENYLKREK